MEDKQLPSVPDMSLFATLPLTLRTAESTNLQATQMAFSRMERLPRACGAYTERCPVLANKEKQVNPLSQHYDSAQHDQPGRKVVVTSFCCWTRTHCGRVRGSVHSPFVTPFTAAPICLREGVDKLSGPSLPVTR